MKTAASKLVKYKLYVMGVHEIRWDKGGSEIYGTAVERMYYCTYLRK